MVVAALARQYARDAANVHSGCIVNVAGTIVTQEDGNGGVRPALWLKMNE